MATLATDDFNRADGGLGVNWVSPDTDSDWILSGNQVTSGSLSGFSIEYYDAVAFPDDQWAEVELVSVSTSSDTGMGAAVRMTAGGNFYFFLANTVQTRLYKRVGGSYTQIGSDGDPAANGNVGYIEVVDDQITVKLDGVTVIGPETDASIASGKAGMWGFNTNGPIGDNWQAGDFSGGGGGGFKSAWADGSNKLIYRGMCYDKRSGLVLPEGRRTKGGLYLPKAA